MSRQKLLPKLLPSAERERIRRYVLDDCGHGTDVFGTDREGIESAWAFAWWLHEHYFKVRSDGHSNIPREGPGLVVGNHSGVLPFDAVMLTADVFKRSEPPRLVRYMVDYFASSLPFVGLFLRQLGQIPGTRANFDGLIDAGHLVGIFPEGAVALGKPAAERYELYPFSHGHVELAARHKIAVIPFGIVGAEEQQTMIANIRPLARALRLPYVPVTTTFPWLGPLGLLPKPVQYHLHYGPAIDIDPAVLHSVSVREHEVARVRDAVARCIEVGRRARGEVVPASRKDERA